MGKFPRYFIAVDGKFPLCFITVDGKFPLCFIDGKFPRYFITVDGKFPLCFITVDGKFPRYFITVDGKFPRYFITVDGKFPRYFITVDGLPVAGRPRWSSGKASASRAVGTRVEPLFAGQDTSDFRFGIKWLPCQAPGVMGSVLGLVGPVSVVYCEESRFDLRLQSECGST